MKQEWDVADIAPSEIDRNTRLDATSYVESRGNPRAVSKAGAQGEYQFMPATARQYGVADPFDSQQARAGADRYLAQLEKRYNGSAELAHLAYNWGEGNVDAWLKTGKGAKGQPMPEEAQQYVGKIMSAVDRQPTGQATRKPVQQWSDADIAPQTTSALPQATKKSAARQAAEATLAEMPTWQRALVGAGKSVADVGRALGLMKDDSSEADAALTDDTAGMVGNLAGEIALTAVPGGAAYKLATAPKRLAQATSAGGKVLRMATGGAAAGATAEGMMGRDPLTGAAYGAVLGPVAETGVRVAGEGIRGVRNLMGGAESAASQKVRSVFDDPNATAASIRALRQEVPGEQLTVGMAATPRDAALKSFEHKARRSPEAERLLQIDAANQAAREAVLEPIAARARNPAARTGQTVPDSPAEAARRAASSPLYRAAEPDMVTLSPQLEEQLLAPEAQRFVRSGQSRYAQEMANSPNKPAAGAWSDPDNGMPAVFSVAELQSIKNELSSAISDLSGSDKVLARQLSDVRRNLNRELEKQSANYAEATSKHRVLSQPQNRGQVAQALLDALRSPAGKERATTFLNARRNAASTIKSSGVDPRFQQIEQVMTPGQMKRIEGLQRSLQREANYANLEAPESIVPKTKGLFDMLEDVTPPMFSQIVTTIRRGFRVLGRRTDAQVDKIINEAVSDPNKFATMLETLPPGDRMKVMNLLSSVGSRNPELAGAGYAAAAGQIGEE